MRAIKLGLLAAALFAPALPAVAQATLLEARESQYNSIFVYDVGEYVVMTFGHNQRLYTESQANKSNPLELPVEYTRLMTLPLAYQSATNKVLEIGLGGGSTVWYLHNTFPQMDIQAVELDPAVAELAQKYFFVKPDDKLKLEVRDGRIFLVRTQEKYDLILVDAYRGPFVPFHLLTKEFFEIAKEKLAPGGVVVQNVEPSTMLYDAAIATIKSVFANVDVYQAGGNYVVIAYDGPPKTNEELLARAAEIDASAKPLYPLAGMLMGRSTAGEVTANVLTDDFAPVESLHATERHNERMPQSQ